METKEAVYTRSKRKRQQKTRHLESVDKAKVLQQVQTRIVDTRPAAMTRSDMLRLIDMKSEDEGLVIETTERRLSNERA